MTAIQSATSSPCRSSSSAASVTAPQAAASITRRGLSHPSLPGLCRIPARLSYCERVSFDPGDVAAFTAFVRAQGQGVVATVSPSGAPEAALVGLAALDDGTLVFDTHAGSRKAENLRHDHRIAVVVGTVGELSVQIEGFAAIAHGAHRERYGAAYAAQFPGSHALDPDFAVVAIRPSWVRVYDASVTPARVSEARW